MNRSHLAFFLLVVTSLTGSFVLRADPAPIAGYNANDIPGDGTVNFQGNVSAWDDNTGNRNTATAPNSGALPSLHNSDPVFNGNDYVYFGTGQSQLVTANAIFTGSQDRSIVAVYGVSSNAIGNSGTAAIAGESGATNVGTWFDLQTRGNGNGAVGDPYLAGFAADDGNGANPTPGRLVFALATYSNSTETIYWAYGNPTTELTTPILSLSTTETLNTNNSPLQLGFDSIEPSPSFLELGDVEVYTASLTAPQADAEITILENQYGYNVPEPSAYALLGLGMLALVSVRRFRCLSSQERMIGELHRYSI